MNAIARKFVFALAAASLALSATHVTAQSKNPRVGDWKLNVEKSKYSPGPAPKSLDLKVEEAGKGVHVTTSEVRADGSTMATEYTGDYDGKDVPLKGSPIADTTSMKMINKSVVVRTDKKGGKRVATYRTTLSKDGKTYKVEMKAKTPKGVPVHNVLVFERQ